jgi:glycosyltransferase involved in cell wall biosynthesis
MKWMDDMLAEAQQLDGVTDHGRIGQGEIVRKMFASGVWAYPCLWPEIYCITAVKVQAAGCVPVSTDFAAIDETVQFGSKIHGEPLANGGGDYSEAFLQEYKDKLIWWLQHPEEQEKVRPKMMDWARKQSWQKVAEEWTNEFQH